MKYERKINNNVTIGILRSQCLNLWLSQSVRIFVDGIVETFTKYTVPIRPNRSFLRKKGVAKRRNMITQINFRRAS